MEKSADMLDKSEIQDRVCRFMLKYILPLPVVRRSYKLRLFTEVVQQKAMQEKTLPPEVNDVVFIGSQYEGLSVTVTSVEGGDAIYAMSDYDTMPVLKHYIVSDNAISNSGQNVDINLDDVEKLTIHEASHAGYCRLQSERTGKFVGMRFNPDCSGRVDIYHDGDHVGETNVPYTDVIPGFFEKPDTVEIKTFVHGPAISCTKIQIHPGDITRTGQEVDVVLSIKCLTWPTVAFKWFHRQTSSTGKWPSAETLEKVKSTGCYVVAVPHHLSPSPNEEWRYSFAPVEKILARSLSFPQKGSYIIAKMLFKTVLENEKVSSYCLKTQMFWLCEETPSWTYDDVGYYALKVLSALAKRLNEGVLQHYIIPENNIVSHISESTLNEVSKTLMEVVCNPFPVMSKIRRSTKFFGIILHPPEDSFQCITKLLGKQSVTENEINEVFCDTKFAIMEHYCSMLKRPIVNIVQEEFSKIKFALLMNIAEDIGNDSNFPDSTSEVVDRIATELSKYTEENVKKWKSFVDRYKEIEEIMKSEDVEEHVTFTYEGILEIEAF